MKQVTVHKDRTTIVPVSLGIDVSADTITSQIREGKDKESDLIATWVVTNVTDGTDGEIVLTLETSATNNVDNNIGYMDMKRVSGGKVFSVFNEPIEVYFQDAITV